MDEKQYTLGDLSSLVEQLHHLRLKYAWIGGQAVGVWASRYLKEAESQQLAQDLGLSFPLTSGDGDIRAQEEVAQLLAHQLEAKLHAVRLKDPTRGKAWFYTFVFLIKMNPSSWMSWKTFLDWKPSRGLTCRVSSTNFQLGLVRQSLSPTSWIPSHFFMPKQMSGLGKRTPSIPPRASSRTDMMTST